MLQKTFTGFTVWLLLQQPPGVQKTSFCLFKSNHFWLFVMFHQGWAPATDLLDTYAIKFRVMQTPQFRNSRVLNQDFFAPAGKNHCDLASLHFRHLLLGRKLGRGAGAAARFAKAPVGISAIINKSKGFP